MHPQEINRALLPYDSDQLIAAMQSFTITCLAIPLLLSGSINHLGFQ
jgi:hypothetical protein